MNIIVCNNTYLTKMTSMPSSSLAQNQALADSIACGEIVLTDCYLLLEHDEVKARAVIMKDISYIGYLTIEAITTKELQTFLQEIQKELNPKQNWFCDVYSDKKHFPIIQQALHQCFAICIERESYTISTYPIDTSKYKHTDCTAISDTQLLSLIKDANESTLDTSIQNSIRQEGSHAYAKQFLNELIDSKEKRSMFRILWHQEQILGFVCVQRLSKEIGGIGYIGVRRQFQSHQYSSILLQIAITIAYQNKLDILIADIDKKNAPMRNNLLATGFTKDCEQYVYYTY